ncbi:MAG: hypothetical protein IJ094_02300 [Bacilli bacterium]|nr:hypothetical protein [Bacilli bacterium]
MTFEKQVKKAKEKKLQYRIIRDVTFILLGIIFLIVSIFMSINDKNNKKESRTTTKKTITTTIKK